MQAAKAGRRVAIVERFPRVGGGCTHWATIPSKALRQAVRQLNEFRSTAYLPESVRGVQVGLPLLLKSMAVVVTRVEAAPNPCSARPVSTAAPSSASSSAART